MLLACHDEIATTHGYAITGGSALLWTKPWNGTEAESAKIETIDPFVIENARIIRLAEQNGRIIAFTAGTKALRVAAKERAGVVGDPWLAILAKAKKPAGKVPKAGKASKVEEPAPAADDGESKSLSIQAFGYDVMQVLALLDESVCVLPPAARIYSFDEERLVLWGRGVAREQGGTQGAHDQQYEVPSGFRAIWSDPAGKTKLAERAAALLADVTHARNKCVFPAAVKLLRAGDAPADNRVSKATDRFMALVRERLAAPLLDFLVMEDSAGTKQWREILMGAAHTVIDAAMDSSPLGGRRFEACSIAANMLAAGFRPWRETAAANATT
jgi:hypothetical protein